MNVRTKRTWSPYLNWQKPSEENLPQKDDQDYKARQEVCLLLPGCK